MTEQIPLEVLDAIREAMEETARRLAKDKAVPTPQPSTSEQATDHEAEPGARPHWRFI
ncbi:MAG TPA: hypothetical protein VIY51_17065 [Xanthobacteraceae bacterium]